MDALSAIGAAGGIAGASLLFDYCTGGGRGYSNWNRTGSDELKSVQGGNRWYHMTGHDTMWKGYGLTEKRRLNLEKTDLNESSHVYGTLKMQSERRNTISEEGTAKKGGMNSLSFFTFLKERFDCWSGRKPIKRFSFC